MQLTNDRLNWDEFHEMAKSIHDRIVHSQCSFDAIIGITRGGVFLAGYLSYHLGIKNVYFINTKIYDNKEKIKPEILYYPGHIHYKNILVVDDIIDSGSTYRLLEDLLSEISDSYSWAVLIDKGQTDISVEFTGMKLNEKRWVYFPWNPEDA